MMFGVPIKDSVDEIKTALAEQDVSEAKRLPIEGRPDILSETGLLTSPKKLPYRVKIPSMLYRVQLTFPNPFRCKKCFCLGHITSRCSDQQSCQNCVKSHTPIPPHSDTCPSFLAMKAIIKTSQSLKLRSSLTAFTAK
jgi:hypothetical protein